MPWAGPVLEVTVRPEPASLVSTLGAFTVVFAAVVAESSNAVGVTSIDTDAVVSLPAASVAV